MPQERAGRNRVRRQPLVVARYIHKRLETLCFRLRHLALAQAHLQQVRRICCGKSAERELRGRETVLQGAGQMRGERALPDILIQAEHDIHTFQFGQFQQHRGNAQPGLVLAVKAVQMIYEQHHGPPQGDKPEPPHKGRLRAAGKHDNGFQRSHRAVMRCREESVHPAIHGTGIRQRLCQLDQGLAQLRVVRVQPVAYHPGLGPRLKQVRRISREHADRLLLVRARQAAIADQLEHHGGYDAGAYLAQPRPARRLAWKMAQNLHRLLAHTRPRHLHVRAKHQRHGHHSRFHRAGDAPKQMRLAITSARGREQQHRLVRTTEAGTVAAMFDGIHQPLKNLLVHSRHGPVLRHLKG